MLTSLNEEEIFNSNTLNSATSGKEKSVKYCGLRKKCVRNHWRNEDQSNHTCNNFQIKKKRMQL
ncbi:hypothetical protein OUZ56_031594 [Daphnia magna]|uniref:Uncharacterized protein n=1 Tax=Daphnia magna TaxID=35525 RepID=A0ABQ9ZUN7_9CRUS|nr:hypothetical protein OUZ56_031594 [Daphnia magna]